MNLITGFRVDGIVWYQLLYCETYNIESYFIEQKMQAAGIPLLRLQSDYQVLDSGPTKTRLEAFMEILKERKSDDR